MRSSSGRFAGSASATASTAFDLGRRDRRELDVPGDHLDADLGQVAVQLTHLVVGELELLEACGNLVVGQVATLLTLRDQIAKLLAFQCCVGEKRFLSCCQLSASLLLRTVPCPPIGPQHESSTCCALPSRDVRRDQPCLHRTTTAQILSRG